MLGPFATAADLRAQMTRDLTDDELPHVDRLLAGASHLIRMTAGYQQITRVNDDAVTLRGSGTPILRLPQRPVRDVTAVAGLASTLWSWDGGEQLLRCDGYAWEGPVTVTYSHGFDIEDVAYQVAALVACDAVKRLLLNPELIKQRSIDDYSETLADARASLMPGEQATIREAFGVKTWGVTS